MMLLSGARVYDPAHGVDGEMRDLYVEDGRIVAPPRDGLTVAPPRDGLTVASPHHGLIVASPHHGRITCTLDLRGKIVMAGAIDLHSHIGGGKVNIARALLHEDHIGTAHGADAFTGPGGTGTEPLSARRRAPSSGCTRR